MPSSGRNYKPLALRREEKKSKNYIRKDQGGRLRRRR